MKLATSFAFCAAMLGPWGPAQAANVQVQVLDGSGKPITDAVVFLDSKDAKAALKPVRDTAIAQVSKEFTPRLTVVPVGSAVDFPNRDKVRHHVYSFSPAKNFELKLYAGTPAAPVVFDRAGVAVLGGRGGNALLRSQRRRWSRSVERCSRGQLPAARLAHRHGPWRSPHRSAVRRRLVGCRCHRAPG
jgi:hypothetical protein